MLVLDAVVGILSMMRPRRARRASSMSCSVSILLPQLRGPITLCVHLRWEAAALADGMVSFTLSTTCRRSRRACADVNPPPKRPATFASSVTSSVEEKTPGTFRTARSQPERAIFHALLHERTHPSSSSVVGLRSVSPITADRMDPAN